VHSIIKAQNLALTTCGKNYNFSVNPIARFKPEEEVMEIQRYSIDNRADLEHHIPHLKTMCDYFTPLGSWLLDQIKSASDVVYVVENDVILGYVIADKKTTHLEIELICVGEEGRRMKGVGTRLMNECEKIAREYALREIRLDAQFRAVDFYKKLGYSEVNSHKQGVLMKKRI
jgi:ribosomal protein S18 acetylase RimI-like enzyme